MVKNYKLTTGDCNNCCLYRECKDNEDGIKHFLLTLGILCETGKCLEVVEGDES